MYAIILDPDGAHPFLVETLFADLTEVAAYQAEYLTKRDHSVARLTTVD